MFRTQEFLIIIAMTISVVTLTGCTSSAVSEAPETESAPATPLPAADPWADIRAEFPDAQIPDVEFISFVTISTAAQVRAACLTRNGFPSEDDNGGTKTFVAEGQKLPFEIAKVTCLIQYPLDPIFEKPFDMEQYQILYDYQTGSLTQCLEQFGYQVPPPPSFETFVETYGQAGSWQPYTLVSPDSDWTELNKQCPQIPEAVWK